MCTGKWRPPWKSLPRRSSGSGRCSLWAWAVCGWRCSRGGLVGVRSCRATTRACRAPGSWSVNTPERRTGGPLAVLALALVVVAALVSLVRSPRHVAPPGVDPDDVAAGYERSDARPAPIVAAGVVLAFVVGLVVVGARGVVSGGTRRRGA